MQSLSGSSEREVLIVVPHPDDEVLGCGGAAAAMSAAGYSVRSCILSGRVAARHHRPADDDLLDDTRAAAAALGMGEPILGDFPNIEMNTVPHIELVRFIEQAIVETRARHVFTVHPGDLNNDHRQVSLACMAAARLSLRRDDLPRVTGLHLMEVPSATDWALPGINQPFQATTFLELGRDLLDRKLAALRCYRDVMRPFPHPRSDEAITGLAAYRGGQAGMMYAEAFQTVHQDLSTILGVHVRPHR